MRRGEQNNCTISITCNLMKCSLCVYENEDLDSEKRMPLGGLIEELMKDRGSGGMGFDVEGTPFADLRYEERDHMRYQKQYTFGHLNQGYLFLCPLKEQEQMTWIDGFICKKNFAKVMKFMKAHGAIRVLRQRGRITPELLDEFYKEETERHAEVLIK